MKPYYENEHGKLYCGDCLEVLPALIAEGVKVDACITDPPYGVNLEYSSYDDSEENWFALIDKAIPLMREISRMVIMPSCQIKRLDWFYREHKPDWLMCWYKGSPGHAGYIGFNDWEPHIVYGKNTNTMHDYFSANNDEKMGSYGHPCPKPLNWAKWLISRASAEEQTILDPFAGSGTTLVAAQSLGRKWIGIEISPDYCEIAKKRLEGTIRQIEGQVSIFEQMGAKS